PVRKRPVTIHRTGPRGTAIPLRKLSADPPRRAAFSRAAAVVGSGAAGGAGAALFAAHGKLLRRLDGALHPLPPHAAPQHHGRRGNRDVPDRSRSQGARVGKHAESGLQRLSVSVPTGAWDPVTQAGRGASAPTQTLAHSAESGRSSPTAGRCSRRRGSFPF